MIGSPRVRAATRLLEVQSGQSGQPRPDALSRTAAPVMMIPAFATTPASATRRIEVGVGKRKGAVQARTPRRALVRPGAGPVVGDAVVADAVVAGPVVADPVTPGLRSAGTDPMVGASSRARTRRPRLSGPHQPGPLDNRFIWRTARRRRR